MMMMTITETIVSVNMLSSAAASVSVLSAAGSVT